jgi:DNA-binding PadR family transcriptional regulator
VSLSTVYSVLERLRANRCIRSWMGAPTNRRGGRRKRHYAIEPRGVAALQNTRRTLKALLGRLDRSFERS